MVRKDYRNDTMEIEYSDGFREYRKQLAEEALLMRFDALEKQMRNEYFWCKVKLNSYAIFLLIMLMVLK